MLTAPELGLILVVIEALTKVIEGHHVGGNPATPADVEAAKERLDKAKAELDQIIEDKVG